jgi:hypothetical protein
MACYALYGSQSYAKVNQDKSSVVYKFAHNYKLLIHFMHELVVDLINDEGLAMVKYVYYTDFPGMTKRHYCMEQMFLYRKR